MRWPRQCTCEPNSAAAHSASSSRSRSGARSMAPAPPASTLRANRPMQAMASAAGCGASSRPSSSSGQVKVMDFGLARLHSKSSANTLQLHKERGLVGTPGYIAPEQARECDADGYRQLRSRTQSNVLGDRRFDADAAALWQPLTLEPAARKPLGPRGLRAGYRQGWRAIRRQCDAKVVERKSDAAETPGRQH